MNNYKKQFYIAASFLVPFAAVILFCIMYNIQPFGSCAVLVIDMDSQYISFFSYLRQILCGEKEVLYSFSKTLGGGIYGFAAYYLLSPFNLILLAFKPQDITIAITIIIFLKICLSSVTFFIFISKVTEYRLSNLLFSFCYAFMAYNLIYMQNVMWLDAVVLLPLVCLGIFNLAKGKSGIKSSILYVTALFCTILANYYIGFMVCLFSGMFFLYLYWGDYCTKRKQALKSFTILSLLSGGLSAFIVLPSVLSLATSEKSMGGISSLLTAKTMFTPLSFIKQLIFPPAFTTYTVASGGPNVFIGSFIIVFLVLYFAVKSIPKKEKILSVIFILLLFLSFYFKAFLLIWHGMSFPVWFLYRNAFLFSFLLLFLSAQAFNAIYDNKKLRLLGKILMYANIITIFIYAQSTFTGILRPVRPLHNYIEDMLPTVTALQEQNQDFFRIGNHNPYNINDSMLLGYNGLTHYSTGDNNINHSIMAKAGYDTTWQWTAYNTGTSLAANSLMGVKYIFSSKELDDNLKCIGQNNHVNVYENPYAFPLMFLTDDNIVQEDIENLAPYNFFNTISKYVVSSDSPTEYFENDVEQTLFNCTTLNNKRKFTGYTVTDGNGRISYSFTTDKSGAVYMYFDMAEYNNNIQVSINNQPKFDYLSHQNCGTMFVGNFLQGENVQIDVFIKDSFKIVKPYFFYTDENSLDKISSYANDNSLIITDFKQNYIKGHINAPSHNMGIFTTIPFDDGWRLYVDGKRQEIDVALDTFIYIPLAKGSHTIVLKFVPKGLEIGIFISFLSLISCVFYMAYKKYRCKH